MRVEKSHGRNPGLYRSVIPKRHPGKNCVLSGTYCAANIHN